MWSWWTCDYWLP